MEQFLDKYNLIKMITEIISLISIKEIKSAVKDFLQKVKKKIERRKKTKQKYDIYRHR